MFVNQYGHKETNPGDKKQYINFSAADGTTNFTRSQLYFERNVMRRVLFQMKPEYWNGKLIPMECFAQVTVIHKFQVLVQRRFNQNVNESAALIDKVSTSKARNSNIAIKKDKQKVCNLPICYYLECEVIGKYNSAAKTGYNYLDSATNIFMPMVFLLFPGRKFLKDPNPPTQNYEDQWEENANAKPSKWIKLEPMDP